jgi:5-methylcytosine-specific restriction endonuclease McrA
MAKKIKCIKTTRVRTIDTARAGAVPVVNRDRGRPWMRKRARVLERDGYLCQNCAKLGLVVRAVEVDHIEPLHRGGSDAEDNLQSLCKACHRSKSDLERLERCNPS